MQVMSKEDISDIVVKLGAMPEFGLYETNLNSNCFIMDYYLKQSQHDETLCDIQANMLSIIVSVIKLLIKTKRIANPNSPPFFYLGDIHRGLLAIGIESAVSGNSLIINGLEYPFYNNMYYPVDPTPGIWLPVGAVIDTLLSIVKLNDGYVYALRRVCSERKFTTEEDSIVDHSFIHNESFMNAVIVRGRLESSTNNLSNKLDVIYSKHTYISHVSLFMHSPLEQLW